MAVERLVNRVAEKRKRVLWKKLRPKISTIAVLLAVFLLVGWLFGKNFYTIYQLKQQKNEIQTKITAEDEKSQQLDADLKQIGTKNYIEMLARKYLNLYYPDEKVVVPVEGEPAQNQDADKNADEGEAAQEDGQNTKQGEENNE